MKGRASVIDIGAKGKPKRRGALLAANGFVTRVGSTALGLRVDPVGQISKTRGLRV